jgi:hypothetical protein
VDFNAFHVFSPATRILLSGPRLDRLLVDFPRLGVPAFFRGFARRVLEAGLAAARFLAIPFFPARFLGMALSR